MKKILILTVTAGNGHNACARSMKEKLESFGGVEVKTVDLLKTFSTKLNVWLTDRGYCIAASKLIPLYNYFYNRYKKAPPEKRYSCPSQGTILTVVSGLVQEILSFQPDVIYTTHFYGAIAVTDLKLAYDLPCATVSFNYDYVNSPFWEAGIGVDYFAIPNEDFIDEFIGEGYRRDQLLPFGLPVDERSLEKTEKAQARKAFGLDENVFTITVMFGGGYWNGGLRIFRQLCKALKERKAQIIMINGKNEKSYKRIASMKFADNLKVLNVGFTKDVPAYMSCADVMINKFGGTSVTEMINKGLPMLITEKLAAQEKYNLTYMKSKGVALSFKNGKELKETVLKLMDDGNLLKRMSENTLPLRKNAISDLAKLILSLPEANYEKLLNQNIDLNEVKKTVKTALKDADRKSRKV